VRRLLKLFTVLVILIVCVLYFAHPPILREFASRLFVEDPLESASAIIILSGGIPYRPLGAAQLYTAGWAPRVVLTRARLSKRDYALKAFGLGYPEKHEVSRQILVKLGVPNEAISVIGGEIHSTVTEAQEVLRELKADRRDLQTPHTSISPDLEPRGKRTGKTHHPRSQRRSDLRSGGLAEKTFSDRDSCP